MQQVWQQISGEVLGVIPASCTVHCRMQQWRII